MCVFVCVSECMYVHVCVYVYSLGLARTIYIYGVYRVFLAGKPPNIRSYTVHIYGFGQPY